MSARRFLSVAALTVSTLLLGACGGGGGGSSIDTSQFNDAQLAGMKVAQRQGCSACHGGNFQGTGTAPTFVGLAGSTVELNDGTTVVADDAYLTESIVKPGAKKVKGYSAVMPTFSLPDADVANLVEFIKALKN